MIVVIADDLTGAAELAGTAFRRGLSVEVQTQFNPASKVDVLALDTDTRWRTAEEAAHITHRVARDVLRARPVWVYKKTDSVLRGNVRVEIESIVSAGGLSGALLVPANPSRGRVIRGGNYFVQGVALDETAFAHDPEYPRTTARVAELLGACDVIRIPDAVDDADLAAHVASLDDRTLPAGGVDFFNALLASRLGKASRSGPASPARSRPCSFTLFVCGSAAAWQQGRAELCERLAAPCLTMPTSLVEPELNSMALINWAQEIATQLTARGRAMAAIGSVQSSSAGPPPRELVARLAEAIRRATAGLEGGRLCAEGGATARAVADRLGWAQLKVVREWAPGVVEFRPIGSAALSLVCKVGSYEWPEALLAELAPAPFDTAVTLPIDGVLDLHTFRPEDLGELIPEYLAQCRAHGRREVRIIHGKGVGNLQRSVEAILRRLDHVETFSPASPLYGGAGALIVKLRETKQS
jgi:D-threonate/D-erythronate kinase